MLPAAPLLFVLFSVRVDSNAAAQAPAPIPAPCRAFRTPPPSSPEEHRPYPVVDRPWPFDASKARIVPDDRVAPRRREDFARVPAEEVRERLRRYVVVSRQEWENGFSHVFGGDQGGWLVSGKECFQWIVRPGGLAWIVYPDGAAVYLAACRSAGRESRGGGDSMPAMRPAFPAKAIATAAKGHEGPVGN